MKKLWSAAKDELQFDSKLLPIEDERIRVIVRAELDVLIARDLLGLTKNEMHYMLDPADYLKEDCGFETFGALKRAEQREFEGEFRTRDRILKTWDTLRIDHEFSTTEIAKGLANSTRAPDLPILD